MCQKNCCKSFDVIKDESHAKILQCSICGRVYRKFWNEDLTQMHCLNDDYIKSIELKKHNESITVIR